MAKRDLVQEIVGLIVIGWAVFLFLCLYSFHPQDPSLNHYRPLSPHIHNFGDFIGIYCHQIHGIELVGGFGHIDFRSPRGPVKKPFTGFLAKFTGIDFCF